MIRDRITTLIFINEIMSVNSGQYYEGRGREGAMPFILQADNTSKG